MIVIVYGPPGSGKGTQAQRVADHFGLIHFDTGKIIEATVHDSQRQDDPVVQRERELFDKGILCTPEWVTELVKENIRKLHKERKDIAFSGSPRTSYEVEQIIPLLEKLYGKDKIFVLRLLIKPETSIFRNSHRRVCEDCGFPIVYTPENEKLEKCPKCGGKLVERGGLDSPETIKVRIEEYQNRTAPVYKFLAGRGITIIDIDGEPSVEEVAKDILVKLSLTNKKLIESK